MAKKYYYREVKNENEMVIHIRFITPEYRAVLSQLETVETYLTNLINIYEEYKESDNQHKMAELSKMINIVYEDIDRCISLKNSFEENEFDF